VGQLLPSRISSRELGKFLSQFGLSVEIASQFDHGPLDVAQILLAKQIEIIKSSGSHSQSDCIMDMNDIVRDSSK
jgi:hypothetical protein